MTPYVKRREGMLYYKIIEEMILSFAPSGNTFIDVGNGGTDVITYGTYSRRIVVDPSSLPEREGVETIKGKWVTVPLPVEKADLVTCCQTLEHIRDYAPFVKRLFSVGTTVLISVPYKWSKGASKGHIHDPIDEDKLEKMTGRVPYISSIVREPEGPQRMICLY